MPIVGVKVHPSIGIARLGNSPDEFFIGPERPLDPPDPPGGFKDGQCRVKRQAARFRVYAYDENGVGVELTAAEADITWTVHVVNRKPAANGRNAGVPPADITIDPGPRTLDGPNQQAAFNGGSVTFPGQPTVAVPLGEARTDDDGRLLVLGGAGTSASPGNEPITSYLDNDGWYDDVSDGPVSAQVHLHATGQDFAATGAWVIVGPAKFAPALDTVTTLYDRMQQVSVDAGTLTPVATPSYTQQIYPILLRAEQSRWVADVPGWAHAWAQPVVADALRQHIYDMLKPGGTMPKLNGQSNLTATQHGWMEKWKDGDFVNDWAGPPPPPAAVTAEGLDRAALEACVGAAFFPGIEAGDFILSPAVYLEPFRFDPAVVSAGDVTAAMALPWQADFTACGTWWWPVPRPNVVIPQGTTTRQDWARGISSYEDMVASWSTLGFVVQQGSEYVEVDRCDTGFIQLMTPSLVYDDVPQGHMGTSRKLSLPIVFEVRSTGAAVTLELQPGPLSPRLAPVAASVTVGPTVGNAVATARLWITYETGTVGEVLNDQATVVHAASGQSWTVPITASTVGRTRAAAALVLDRSGSMAQDRGDGQSKVQSLREAAAIFVDAMLEEDGVAVVRYDHDAQLLQAVTALGPATDPMDPGRSATKALIAGPQLDPAGATSIGDGIFAGRGALTAVSPADYPVRALVVLTDGMENSPRWIADVSAEINERTYAVGLGTPQNTSAAALQTLSGSHGGFLLVTGAIGTEQQFILQKYFLQILAGVSNAEVVLDPTGVLVAGDVVRIPFELCDADTGVDVFLLTPSPGAVDFRLQTPNGFLLEPWRAGVDPRIRYVQSAGVAYYRLALPAELRSQRFDREGTWHVILSMGEPRRDPPAGRGARLAAAAFAGAGAGADAALLEDTSGQSHPYPRAVSRAPARHAAGHGAREQAALLRGMAVRDAVDRAVSSQPVPDAGPALAEAAAVAAERGRQKPRAVPYSVLVHAYSSVTLRCSVRQRSFEPGSEVWVDATLAEAGAPAQARAHVWAEVTRPDGSLGRFELDEHEEGRFGGAYFTAEAGVYRLRVRARGRTGRGHAFHREQTLTVPVWPGGDKEPRRDLPESGAQSGGGRPEDGRGPDGGRPEGGRRDVDGPEPRGCLGWLMDLLRGGSR
jgi:hypothetical protein